MIKFLIFLPLLAAAGCTSSGFQGSGRLITKTIPAGAFDRIDAGNAFHVEVSQGPAYSLAITADDNLWDQVDYYNHGGLIHLGMKPGSYQNAHLSARIILPQLVRIDLAGAASAQLTGVNTPASRITMRLDGASNLDGDVRCGQLLLDVSGAASVRLRGGADLLALNADGASHARLSQFTTRITHARLGGAAEAAIDCTGELDFDVSGAAQFSYSGHPIIRQAESSGAATVHAVR